MESHQDQTIIDMDELSGSPSHTWTIDDFPPLVSTSSRPTGQNVAAHRVDAIPTAWSGQRQRIDQAVHDPPVMSDHDNPHNDSPTLSSPRTVSLEGSPTAMSSAQTVSLDVSPVETPDLDSLSNNTSRSLDNRDESHGLVTRPCACAEVVAQLVHEAMHNLVTEFKLRRQQDVARLREVQAEARWWKWSTHMLMGGLVGIIIAGGVLGLCHLVSEQSLKNMWFC